VEGQAVPGHMVICSSYLLKPHLSLTRGLLLGCRDCATINFSYQTINTLVDEQVVERKS